MEHKTNEAFADLVSGRNPVLELLKSGRDIDKIFVQKASREGSIRLIVAEARNRGIPVVEVEKVKLDSMTNGTAHQGVAASAAQISYATVKEILQVAEERGEKPLILICDGVEDPHNLGAILRTAECAGAHGVIIPKRHSATMTGAVAKASAGALEYIKVAKVPNLSQTVRELKEAGLWIYAADMDGQSYTATDMTGPAAIILGGEDSGVSRLLREESDYVVSIPMKGKVNSLNVSNAAAVLVYEAVRQRSALAQ